MQKIQRNIIKAEQIEMQGTQPLDISQTPQQPNKQNSNANQGRPSVSIIEKNENFAKLKITCSCGEEMILKCNYKNKDNTQQKND